MILSDSKSFVMVIVSFPNPPLVGPLNVYHLLMIGMIVYGIVWWRRYAEAAQPAAV